MTALARCLKHLVITLGLFAALSAQSAEPAAVDALLDEASGALFSTPEKAMAPLEKLRTLQSELTPFQRERYQLYQASSLGFRGKHEERVDLVRGVLPQVTTPARRANFLYELIDGNAALGRYEAALNAMNESILLLPRIEISDDKIGVLQSAVSLLSSLRAYDEALDFSERIYVLRSEDQKGVYAACIGLANQVEINFLRSQAELARSLAGRAILACNASKSPIITLIVRSLVAIDLIDSGNHAAGLSAGLPLLKQYAVMSESSDYLSQLEDALARAYLNAGNLGQAEYYGFRAYQRAQSGKALAQQERTSATMAAIKRAQGQLAQAMTYYDVNLALKQSVMDDQMQKNMAYQRVKFDTQDKANQLALLEQKNKNLRVEKELQKRENQNLVLWLTLGLVLLVIVGGWLIKALQQKHVFRQSAQIDGLTHVCNRTHFVDCAHRAFKDSANRVSLVLFDMDHFKDINDSFGHAAGDWVLKAVCDAVKTQLRKTDLLGRVGGEEFAMCLPQVGTEEVNALAERCRAAIAAIDTTPCGFEFQVTASFGIAAGLSDGLLGFEETLAAADKALYFSKHEGRNRISAYQHAGI